MSAKGFKIKLGTPSSKHRTRNNSAEPSNRYQPDSPNINPAKIAEKLKTEEPLIDFRRAFEELKTEVRELFNDFHDFVIKEDIGTHLKGLLEIPQKLEPIALVRCIKQTFKSIIRLPNEAEQETSKINYTAAAKQNKKGANRLETDYELLLQKAEQDIKNHIRTEHQLKGVIEMLQAKFEQQEKMRSSTEMTVKFAINDMRSDTAKLLDIIKAKDDEIANLHIIVRNYKEQVQSLEMQLLGIHVLEVKLRNLNHKHQKEAGEMKKYYETELANLTKETSQIHKALSSNLAHDEKFKLIQKEVETYTQVNIQKMQTLEAKIKYLQELAERASSSPVHGARRNSKIEGLKQSAMSGTGMVSPQKDMSLNNREGNVLRESVKADSVVLKSYNTFADYVNDNEVKQNDVKDEVFIASSEKKMGYNNISGIRRTKETQEASKAVFEKQRKRLLQEINILSIKRTGDLSNQTKEAYNNFAFNDTHFNNYYEQMVAKLDSLTQLNDKEKMELHKLDPRGFSARHRHSKSVGGRSAVRLNLGANFPKPSGEEALSMSQSPDKITSHKKKLERSSSLIKAIKQAKKIVFKSTSRPTTAN